MRLKMQTVFFHACLLIAWFISQSLSAAPKFYEDDPIWKEVDAQDASDVDEWEIDLVYDLAENMFTKPGDKTPNVRAQNINTVDEVPDSSWFTNRAGKKALTPEEVTNGPNTTTGPAPGTWSVVAAKNDGISPGFTIKDSRDIVWFIKFDPPGYPSMATGTEVTVTKLFWVLGYNVPENHIATMRAEDLVIDKGTMIRTPSGKKRPMKIGDIKDMLRGGAHKNADGSYRVHASKKLDGKILGGIRFHGTRPDDPNDVIPHEHRRELRGYLVFAAWFNHVDSKAINAMDTLITSNGKSYVRHHLLDFSSTLGSGSIYPREYWEGYEHLYEGGGPIGKDIISFGLKVEPWRTQPYYESPAVGKHPDENTAWDPEGWRPRAPNAAFLRARADDKFWAARKAIAITDDLIAAAVKAGQFDDPESEAFLIQALIDRRNAIGRTYLTAINPVADPKLDSSGVLTFTNVAVEAGFAQPPQSYETVWYRFDNNTGNNEKIGAASGSSERLEAPSGLPSSAGAFVKVEISASSTDHPIWKTPVHAYFKRTGGGWDLVGFERMPDENAQ